MAEQLGTPLVPADGAGVTISAEEMKRIRDSAWVKFPFTVGPFTYDAQVAAPGRHPRTEIFRRHADRIDDDGPWIVVNFHLDEAACKAVVIVHQLAFDRGQSAGRAAAQADIRQALGVPGWKDVEPRHVRLGG